MHNTERERGRGFPMTTSFDRNQVTDQEIVESCKLSCSRFCSHKMTKRLVPLAPAVKRENCYACQRVSCRGFLFSLYTLYRVTEMHMHGRPSFVSGRLEDIGLIKLFSSSLMNTPLHIQIKIRASVTCFDNLV